MEITKVSETAIMKNPHGVDARAIYSHENAKVMILTLQSGESLKRHITPVDVFFYVLEGKGIVEVGDEKMDDEKLAENIIFAIDHIEHALPRGKANIKNILLKTTMGAPVTLE